MNVKGNLVSSLSQQIEFGPIETAYARAFATSLRRILLSSLPGAAITSFFIEGVLHEFQDIPHVKEDVTEIVHNLKKVRLRSFMYCAVYIHLDVCGARKVYAGDIRVPGTIEIVNPDLPIATLDEEYPLGEDDERD